MEDIDVADIVKQWPVERKNLSELIPAEYNPRTILADAFAGLGVSVNIFGMLVPIVWNKRTGRIVGGHQRHRILLEKGETETDVTVVDLDEDAEIQLNIVLNNQAIRGEFTNDVIDVLKASERRLGEKFHQLQMTGIRGLLQKKSKSGGLGSRKSGKRHTEEKSSKNNTRDNDPDAVITCPVCQSRFRMKDSEILFNAVLDDSDEEFE